MKVTKIKLINGDCVSLIVEVPEGMRMIDGEILLESKFSDLINIVETKGRTIEFMTTLKVEDVNVGDAIDEDGDLVETDESVVESKIDEEEIGDLKEGPSLEEIYCEKNGLRHR